jgi:pyridoxal phosphate enzyme (YggS family)
MNLQDILHTLAAYHATLVAVSKTQTNERILEIYNQGQRIFGENRVQEVVSKYEQLPKDIEWHLIGQLQTNKVKYITPFIHLIHSVDSLHLLEEINRRAMQHNRIIPCLLQIRIALEDTKSGMDETELNNILSSDAYKDMKHVQIKGLMGMATHTDEEDRIRFEFRQMKNLFDATKQQFFPIDNNFDTLSMGMSDDYKIALEEGSNMVRIGSLIFRG